MIAHIIFPAGIAFIVDQLTKWLILEHVMQPPRLIEVLPFFNLTLGFNTGVSFGLFSETLAAQPQVLIVANLLIVIGLLAWAQRTPVLTERLGIAVIAGGALGNIVDRWRQGAVTDFLDFHWAGWHWPAFNGADVFIFVGFVLMFLSCIRKTSCQVREGQV
uniref:signal peptidase II n=1 Tax=Marinobacterium profundum TaxID=1714300 RepID=UPI00083694F0|nr:signal peptidase II [Marinobacterium profundum]